MRPHRRQPTRLPRPWDSPGKNTGVGCHFLLQCMKVKSESEVFQSCPTLSNAMDCSLPGSSIHGIFQARALEWGAIAFSNFIVKSCYLEHLSSPRQRIFLIKANGRKIFQARLRHSPALTAGKGLVQSEWGSTVQGTLAQASTEAPFCYWNSFLGAMSQWWRISSFCI